VKVKLGSIAAAFKGQAHFLERDDANHKAVLKADGRDTTGKGNASASITAEAEEVDADHTKVVVATELHITGRVAQFGRGIVADVSKKLINQFAHNLNTMLDGGAPEPEEEAAAAAPAATEAPQPSDAGSTQAAPDGAAATDAPAAGTPAAPATVRKIQGPAAEPVELSSVAGPAVVKRLLPLLGGLVLLVLIVRRLRK
jgi:hypothetical protein